MAKYYKKNPERCRAVVKRAMAKKPEYYRALQKAYIKKYIKNLFENVIGHYSNGSFKCACCGETERDFLTLDHVNGNGNKERLRVLGKAGGGYRFYRWLLNQGYPEGYAVLCSNCNLSKAKHGTCVHNRLDM